MSSSLKELMENGGQLEPLSVEQYHRMIETGILPEGAPIELLDGVLVRKDRAAVGEDLMTVGTRHAWAVQNLAHVLRDLPARGCHLRVQQPITILPIHEPEPDGAIVLGDNDAYRNAHPAPEQIVCIIEVAESSLQHDRTTKQRVYAEAGIGQYVLINLVEGVVEFYTPASVGAHRYSHPTRLAGEQKLKIQLREGALELPVASLLP